MKRINLSVCHILLAVITIPSTAAALGLEVTAGAWYQSPKGQLAFKPDDAGDILDIENDLKYEDETQFLGRLKIDMPLLIPNVYVMATPMEFEGTGRKDLSFKFGDVNFVGSADFFSKTTLDNYDIALYYGIPLLETATLDKLNIDLGVNVRIIDFETKVTQESSGIDETKSLTLPIPMVFAALQFRPIERLTFEAEGRGIAIGNDKTYSLLGRLRLNVIGPVFVTGGYRYDNIDIDEKGVVIDADFKGPFAEAGLSF
jgi:outer membrane protein